MKTTLTLPAIALLVLTAPAIAQEAPGAHFVENFDMNQDGMVTFAEVQEKRGEIFYMFDQDEDGSLTSEEYDLFDETRAADHENMEGAENKTGGNGNGGHGNGGHGNGGHGGGNQGEGMSREMTDLNHNGVVTQEEFLKSTENWFLRKDRNHDNMITVEDFGPRRG